ncbi:NodT family efflux transporter outer membrane factor (OMF) lipoprotein [Pelomonas aquatica]|uniref:NodT family efflux transporter outer membrane factor (OMF) lipoprotein n=1 Tax=Pelomonas aquatica TaxID=431058 RepID=A0ABU1ZCW7_9BURK|nr:efflux transporter outer membrane subunit [Pelomonas aquatica]MDR7298477.1 NodT family efflux transporter outer membrane factor (OMF) lipoprotein [Pelomonas aquatica]
MKTALSLLTLALLAACAGPETKKPSAAEAAQAALPAPAFPNAGGSGTAAAELPWAQAFQGARLQQLIPLALANNRDLRVAAANIEAARATAAARDADLWPTVNAGLTGSRVPNASGGITSTYQAGLQVSAYEIDLFGRLRSLGSAAQAQLLAAEANQLAVRNALVAAVATAEIALQADEALLKLTRDTLASREQSLSLIRQRFDGGIASELDLRAGESALQAARVALAQTQRQRALDENALVLLLGSALPPGLPAPTGLLADFEPLAELPAGVPSEVLTRRPDIRQAEAQLAAADANIGAARAAFLPRITLTGSFGTASSELSGLFKNSVWSFAPSLIQPLFDAGRNRANLAGARAARDAATAQYEKAVQSAFRDVADALAGRATLGEQRAAQGALVDAEARRLALAEERYRAGIASSLDVLDAQRSLFAAQQALVQVQSQRAQNLVAVYRVLGGGS